MKTINKNKKAYFEYQILDEYVAGIQLKGSEIKPIKNNQASIKESYCYIKDGEVFITGMHVPVETTAMYKHDTTRVRKLLLNKKEIEKIEGELSQKGLTMVPLSINLTSTGLIKVKLGIGKGKKLYDKRESIKLKDQERDTQRKFK